MYALNIDKFLYSRKKKREREWRGKVGDREKEEMGDRKVEKHGVPYESEALPCMQGSTFIFP